MYCVCLPMIYFYYLPELAVSLSFVVIWCYFIYVNVFGLSNNHNVLLLLLWRWYADLTILWFVLYRLWKKGGWPNSSTRIRRRISMLHIRYHRWQQSDKNTIETSLGSKPKKELMVICHCEQDRLRRCLSASLPCVIIVCSADQDLSMAARRYSARAFLNNTGKQLSHPALNSVWYFWIIFRKIFK